MTIKRNILRSSIEPESHYLKPHCSKKEGGFTLLELLISITIIGIIVVIVANAFRLSFRSIDMADRTIESLERLRASFRIISSQIQSEIPLKYDKEGQKEYYLKGDKEYLQLSTNYSIFGGQKGYALVKYIVEQEGSGKYSLYATESIVGIEDERKVKLLSNFDEIYFEYFYTDPTAEEGEWTEEIKDEDQKVPEKILLHVTDGQKKYSFVFPVRVWRQPFQQQQGILGEGF